MTELASTDYTNKRIHLHADTMSAGVSIALYQEIYDEMITTAAKQTWSYLACDAEGYAPKTATKKTARRLLLPTGWKIVPYDASHKLELLIEIVNIEDSLENIGCFDRSTLAAGTDIDIDTTAIDKVEVIIVNIGGSVSQDTLDAILSDTAAMQPKVGELHIAADLDATKQQTYADDGSTIVNDDFTRTNTDNGDGTFDVVKS